MLLPPDRHRAIGLSFHLADLFVPELKTLAASAAEAGATPARAAVPGPALRVLLAPFCRMLEATPDLHVLTRFRCVGGRGGCVMCRMGHGSGWVTCMAADAKCRKGGS